jgi:hypothetical protein
MQLTWNTAFQHHILEKLWPEVEVNSTFSKGGEDNGDKQTFLTPGADTEKYQAARASAFTARSRGRKGRLKAVPKRGPQGRIARPTNAILTCQPARTWRGRLDSGNTLGELRSPQYFQLLTSAPFGAVSSICFTISGR